MKPIFYYNAVLRCEDILFTGTELLHWVQVIFDIEDIEAPSLIFTPFAEWEWFDADDVETSSLIFTHSAN